MSHLSVTEHKYYTDTFNKMDKDRNGYIDIKELGEFCESFDAKISFADVKRMFNQIDKNNDGKIALHEFLAVAPHVTKEDEAEDKKMKLIFNKIDKNGDGYLSVEEVRMALGDGSEEVSLSRAKTVVAKMDTNGDGMIDEQELLSYHRLKKMFQNLQKS